MITRTLLSENSCHWKQILFFFLQTFLDAMLVYQRRGRRHTVPNIVNEHCKVEIWSVCFSLSSLKSLSSLMLLMQAQRSYYVDENNP